MVQKQYQESILVVDDALDTLEVIQRNLKSKGYKVFTAFNVSEAIDLLNSIGIDLVITDLKMPKVSGLELIKYVRENFKETEVMMITGYATVDGAVKAIKNGADEYLSKPFTDEELFYSVEKTLEKLHMRKIAKPKTKKDLPSKFGIIGNSVKMDKVYNIVEKVAPVSATVLITGESGTGKELVARAIHYNSKRASFPFVCVNCASIPESLLESELFGHVKGAFTGANESRAGFFQTADGGTIFLDEIGDTNMAMQVKLLRVLQEKEICMVGSTKSQKVNIRVLAATNKDLFTLVKQGKFREDLFFRLNVISVSLPPLRDREDDILLLISHFIEKYSKDTGKIPPEFSDEALSILRNYYWPGNVRELENIVQSLVVLNEGTIIDVPDLPALMRFSLDLEKEARKSMAEVEAEHIKNVLIYTNNNKTKASKILGISRKTLRDKIKRYNIEEQIKTKRKLRQELISQWIRFYRNKTAINHEL